MKKIRYISMFLFCISLCGAADTTADQNPASQGETSPNLYWPGDFEGALFGGIYSSKLNVVLTTNANHTFNGKVSWLLTPKGYQHLELLLPVHSKFKVSFWAKCESPVTVTLKIVGSGEDGKTKVTPVEVVLDTKGKWENYSAYVETTKSFPGSNDAELLFTCWNASDAPCYIDDLSVAQYQDPSRKDQAPVSTTRYIKNGDFEDGVTGWVVARDPANTPIPMGSVVKGKGNPGSALILGVVGTSPALTRSAAQVIPHTDLGGKRIKISADVAFLSQDDVENAWCGILFELADGISETGTGLHPTPAPFWYVFAKAQPAGKFGAISALYDVPAGSKNLYLQVQALPQMGKNAAAVDNIRIEIVGESSR